MTLLIAAVAVACAGLGLWLGTTIADDTGSMRRARLVRPGDGPLDR
jgi:hypothetical protein